MHFLKLSDCVVANQRVLIRADMNAPLQEGRLIDDTRIRASLPSIQYCLAQGAMVIVMTHLGRPEEGKPKPEDSVQPIAHQLARLLRQPVSVINDWQNGIKLSPGQVVMLENVRLNPGEKQNDPQLGKRYADLCDVFVHDAFGTAHRAEASTHAVAQLAKTACAGLLLTQELEALSKALAHPARPLVAIVGGAKISTKLTVLNTLAEQVDQLIVGGGIANTFLLAAGYPIGRSLADATFVPDAKKIIDKIQRRGGEIPLPTDVVVASELSQKATASLKRCEDIAPNDMILDIGSDTGQCFAGYIAKAKTIVWNGPMGVFEWDQFANGTRLLSDAIAQSSAFSIAGGGETLAAIARFNIADQVSYISTGGGAFLEFLEGKPLPAVEILTARAKALSGYVNKLASLFNNKNQSPFRI